MRPLMPFVLCLSLAAGTAIASANPGLENESDINSGLLAVMAADKIRRSCEAIDGRLFTAQAYLRAIADRAVARGYTEDEIRAYIDDDTEKAKMRERRNAYFQSQGASNLDPQSLCELGRAEIESNSQIGQLLRAK